MNTYAIHVLEELAQSTWERICLSEQYRCSQGEETITDINLLEIKRARVPNIRIWKLNKGQESEYGIDWEWWIGSDVRGWWRYAVQAKKLDSQRRYSAIRHTVGRKFQIELVEEYAESNNCIPLYCFYNYIDIDTQPFWHCNLPYQQKQLGCTVAPLSVALEVFQKRASKRFEAVHQNTSVCPWRCLIRCPPFLPSAGLSNNPLANGVFSDIVPVQRLPALFRQEEPPILQVEQLSSDFYRVDWNGANQAIYPNNIMVIDVD